MIVSGLSPVGAMGATAELDDEVVEVGGTMTGGTSPPVPTDDEDNLPLLVSDLVSEDDVGLTIVSGTPPDDPPRKFGDGLSNTPEDGWAIGIGGGGV
jgi:hypothetical protein